MKHYRHSSSYNEYIPNAIRALVRKDFNKLSAALADMVLELVTEAAAEAEAQAIAAAQAEARIKRNWPAEMVGVDLLDYVAWTGDGGQNCD